MITDAIRNKRNRVRKSRIWTFEKKFRKAVAEKDFEAAQTFLGQTVSELDKAAKTNVVHSNKASRKKARLTAFLKQAQA